MLIVSKLFNIAVNDVHAKKSFCFRWMLVVTKLVVSGVQCNFSRIGCSNLSPFLKIHVHMWIKNVTALAVVNLIVFIFIFVLETRYPVK